MNSVDHLMDQLNDIAGIDSINAWPLAIGWWIVIGLAVVILSLATWYLVRWIAFRRSWRYDTLDKLNRLLSNLSDPNITASDIHGTAILFSEYLRRIALRRFSRNACAGLTGQAWLEWLSKHDANKFDWMSQGRLLVDAPYAPANSISVEQLKTMIHAAKEWVR